MSCKLTAATIACALLVLPSGAAYANSLACPAAKKIATCGLSDKDNATTADHLAIALEGANKECKEYCDPCDMDSGKDKSGVSQEEKFIQDHITPNSYRSKKGELKKPRPISGNIKSGSDHPYINSNGEGELCIEFQCVCKPKASVADVSDSVILEYLENIEAAIAFAE